MINRPFITDWHFLKTMVFIRDVEVASSNLVTPMKLEALCEGGYPPSNRASFHRRDHHARRPQPSSPRRDHHARFSYHTGILIVPISFDIHFNILFTDPTVDQFFFSHIKNSMNNCSEVFIPVRMICPKRLINLRYLIQDFSF